MLAASKTGMVGDVSERMTLTTSQSCYLVCDRYRSKENTLLHRTLPSQGDFRLSFLSSPGGNALVATLITVWKSGHSVLCSALLCSYVKVTAADCSSIYLERTSRLLWLPDGLSYAKHACETFLLRKQNCPARPKKSAGLIYGIA